jgi:hypothetical protein
VPGVALHAISFNLAEMALDRRSVNHGAAPRGLMAVTRPRIEETKLSTNQHIVKFPTVNLYILFEIIKNLTIVVRETTLLMSTFGGKNA